MKIPKPKKLRTDIGVMDDKDIANWIEDILKNTHYLDVKLLSNALNEAVENHELAITFEKVTKMCDKCEITFPEHITICDKCGNDRLRSFRIVNNLVEILGNGGVPSTPER